MNQSTRHRVLLLPGLLCDELAWQDQARALKETCDCFIADFSQFDALSDMAVGALALVDGPVHVVGHSMGGRVAFEAWRLAPERIRSLVLLDTGVHGARPGEAESRQVLLDVAATQGMRALADAWLPPMVHPDRRGDIALMAPLRDMVMRFTPTQHARQIRALLARPDVSPLLATIAVPTLVAVGRQDRWSPIAQHEEMVRSIRGARLEIVEESGHMSTVEQPDAVTSLLGDWLAGR